MCAFLRMMLRVYLERCLDGYKGQSKILKTYQTTIPEMGRRGSPLADTLGKWCHAPGHHPGPVSLAGPGAWSEELLVTVGEDGKMALLWSILIPILVIGIFGIVIGFYLYYRRQRPGGDETTMNPIYWKVNVQLISDHILCFLHTSDSMVFMSSWLKEFKIYAKNEI